MAPIVHFLKYSFGWNLKWFIPVNLITIVCLIVMDLYSSSIPIVKEDFTLILVFYTVLAPIYLLTGTSYHNNTLGWFFSGKYVQSLPLSKLKFIFALAIKEVYCLIPVIVSVLWMSFRLKKGIMPIIENNPFFSIACLFLIYFNTVFLVIEGSSVSFNNKGRGTNFLRGVQDGVRLVLLFVVLIFVLAIGLIYVVLWPIALLMLLYGLYHFWSCYRRELREELHYWNNKKNWIEIAVLVALVSIVSYLMFLVPPKDREEWRCYHAKGHKIFKDVSKKRLRKVVASNFLCPRVASTIFLTPETALLQ